MTEEKKPFTRQQRIEAAKHALTGLLAKYGTSQDPEKTVDTAVKMGDMLLQRIESQDSVGA